MSLFVDDDGTGYLISEDRDAGTHFYQLSADYLTIETDVGLIPEDWMPGLESPAVLNVDGVYYFFGSQLTGWYPVRPPNRFLSFFVPFITHDDWYYSDKIYI